MTLADLGRELQAAQEICSGGVRLEAVSVSSSLWRDMTAGDCDGRPELRILTSAGTVRVLADGSEMGDDAEENSRLKRELVDMAARLRDIREEERQRADAMTDQLRRELAAEWAWRDGIVTHMADFAARVVAPRTFVLSRGPCEKCGHRPAIAEVTP